MTFCGNCGTNNPNSNRFCYNCGAELTMQPEAPPMGYAPVENREVERIGPYNPNANYYVPPQQYHPQYQQYQQPPQQYPPQQYPQYQQQYQQQGYGQYPPMGQYPPQQKQAPQPVYLYGAPNNNANLRMTAIILSIATLVVAIVTLCGVPTDNGDFGTTLMALGLGPDAAVLLVFVILTILIGIVGVLIPIFSIVTGVAIMGCLTLVLTNSAYHVGLVSMIIFLVLALLVILLGLFTSLMMNKYVRSNVRNVTMFQCCLMTWKGIKLPGEGQQSQQI